MNILRKIILTLCVLALLFSGVSFSGNSNMSSNEKADVLKKINIFKGDETGYNLPGKLRRSEAAAFVVRLMGKEAYVLQNKQNFSVSALSDVSKDDWFYPYVSFCYTNGIIKGFPNGTFEPNSYITEKAFSQLILGVMGYKSGVDFDWENIKRFIYEKELTDNVDYTVNTDDNSNYIRGNAVDIIYESLTKKIKNGEKTVIENLIDSNVISLSIAKSLGFVKVDEIKTKIEDVTVNSERKLTIKMNEPVIVNADDIKIYANDLEMDVINFETTGNDLIITVSGELYDERRYRLQISKLYDKDDNISSDFEKDFKGIERPAIESKYFKISKVNVISPAMIEVLFTQPIDDSAEIELLYDFYKNGSDYFEGNYKTIDVSKIKTIDNGVIISSDAYTFDNNNEYTVSIKGDLVSTYGANMNMGQGDSYKFFGTSISDNEIEVMDAYISESDRIEVVFTEKFDYDSAVDRGNYYIIDDSNNKITPVSVITEEFDEDYIGRKVILKFTNLKTYKEYTLYVDNVEDIYGNSYVKNYEEDLGAGQDNSIHVSIDEIEAISRDLIVIDFDIPLDEASENAYVSINNNISVKDILFDSNEPSRLYVFLNKGRVLKDNQSYDLRITRGLKDAYGRVQKYELSDSFGGNSDLRNLADIESAYYTSEEKIVVKFTDFIRKNDLINANNYEFEYVNGKVSRKIFPVDVDFVDNKTAIITMDFIPSDGKFYILADDMHDFSGQYSYNDMKELVDLNME